MDSLRRRVPFTFSEQDDTYTDRVMDEQEQEEVIQRLREENEQSAHFYYIFVRVIVLLSAVLQFIQLAISNSNPILTIFPQHIPPPATNIPFGFGFTLLALFIHLNLSVHFHPNQVRSYFQLTHNPQPLSYGLLYVLSAVPPTLSLFLRLPWQTTLWWSFTAVIVFIVQSVMDAVQSSTQSISELETMRYVAPGA